jgi:hypothetical protein
MAPGHAKFKSGPLLEPRSRQTLRKRNGMSPPAVAAASPPILQDPSEAFAFVRVGSRSA